MKTLLLSCFLGLLATVASNAASINFDTGGGTGHMFVTAGGSRLPIGSVVRLGTLTEAGNASSFVEFATTTINNTGGASTFTGFLRDGVQITTPAAADAIKGKQIYLFVYNTTDLGQINSTPERGLFTSAEWTLPAGFDSAATTVFNVKLGGTPPTANPPGTPLTGGTALIGQYAQTTITINTSSNPNASVYTLAPIPEPSTVLLGSLVALMTVGRRKR